MSEITLPTNINEFALALLRQADDAAKSFRMLITSSTAPTDQQKSTIASAYLVASNSWLQGTLLVNQLFANLGAEVANERTASQQGQPIFRRRSVGGEQGTPFRLNTDPTAFSEQLDLLKRLCLRIGKFDTTASPNFDLTNYFNNLELGAALGSLAGVYGQLCFQDNTQMTNPCSDSTNTLNLCWAAELDATQNAYISNIILACALLTAQQFYLYSEMQSIDGVEDIVVQRIREAEAQASRKVSGGLEDIPDRITIKDELTFQFQELDGSSTDANSLGRVGLNNLIPSLGENKNLGGYIVALLHFIDYFLKHKDGVPVYVRTRKDFINYANNLLESYNQIMFEVVSNVDKEELARRKAEFEKQLKDAGLNPSLERFATDRLRVAEEVVEGVFKKYGSAGVGVKLALLNPALGVAVGSMAFTAQMSRQIDDITERAKDLCEKMEILILLNMQKRDSLPYGRSFSTYTPPIEPLFAPVSSFKQAHDRAHETCFATADVFWCKVYTYTASALVLGLATYGIRRLIRANQA